jgi:hypothetical protein
MITARYRKPNVRSRRFPRIQQYIQEGHFLPGLVMQLAKEAAFSPIVQDAPPGVVLENGGRVVERGSENFYQIAVQKPAKWESALQELGKFTEVINNLHEAPGPTGDRLRELAKTAGLVSR